MKKKRLVDCLPIPKCKRIIRPLVSKINALTDLYAKFPSKFEFQVDNFALNKPAEGVLKFTHPPTADDRLASLKPYISHELYQAYKDIFSLFRNVILTLCEEKLTLPIPKLSSLASYKIGKCITLGTKTTYHRLNQTLLFEPDTIPQYQQKYKELANDIDEWLQIEPSAVSETYRKDLLLGYIIHILVFNLRTLLYLLIPVLAQWLKDCETLKCKQLLRTLFIEYWQFLPRDPDQTLVLELTLEVTDSNDLNLALFWLLQRIGYWQHLILDLKVASLTVSLDAFSPYDGLVLDALATSDRLVLPSLNIMDTYLLLRRCSQHPHNTSILVSTVAQIIDLLKKKMRRCTTSNSTLQLLVEAYESMRRFLQYWLSISSDCVFNSIDRGNEDIFQALYHLLKYILSKCTHIFSYLNECLLAAPSGKVREMLTRFKNLYYRVDMVRTVIRILEAYFLDKDNELSLTGLGVISLARYFTDLTRDSSDKKDMGRFLTWLNDREGHEMRQFAQECFKLLYKGDWTDRGLEDVHSILFEE